MTDEYNPAAVTVEVIGETEWGNEQGRSLVGEVGYILGYDTNQGKYLIQIDGPTARRIAPENLRIIPPTENVHRICSYCGDDLGDHLEGGRDDD